MSGILGQLSIAVGGIMFVIVLIITIARGVPVLVAVFRASVVMCISTVVSALFFRFFTSLLYRFVAEQVIRQRHSRTGNSKKGKDITKLVEGR